MAGKNERTMRKAFDDYHNATQGAIVLGLLLVNRAAIKKQGAGVPGSPVDTGENRSGHIGGVGSMPTFRPPDEAPHYPIAPDSELIAAYAHGKVGDNYYHGNNVPYSGHLDDGVSPQAPDGYYGQAIDWGMARGGY